MSTYCIGDVHGCYEKLNQLLDKIGVNTSDQLWFTGDLINRGEDSFGVLRLVKKHGNVKVVFGNHELYWLACYFCPKLFGDFDLGRPFDLEELIEWVCCSWSFYYQNRDYFLVHAGFFPFWSLNEGLSYFDCLTKEFKNADLRAFLPTLFGKGQVILDYDTSNLFIVETLLRMRFCSQQKQLNLDITEKPSSRVPGLWKPWFELLPKDFPKTVLFGHWAALEGEVNHPKVIALDTGCIWGGKLTAYCLETKDFYRV